MAMFGAVCIGDQFPVPGTITTPGYLNKDVVTTCCLSVVPPRARLQELCETQTGDCPIIVCQIHATVRQQEIFARDFCFALSKVIRSLTQRPA